MVEPRRIVPLVDAVAPEPADLAAPSAPPHLQYHGGPILGAVEVVLIFWGGYWTQGGPSGDGPQLQTSLNQFFDFILTSEFMSTFQEYSTSGTRIGNGRRISTVNVTSDPGDITSTGRQVTDAQIQEALQNWITNHTVPATTANTLYFVYLPPDVTSILGTDQSCQKFCGYHEHIGTTIFYAVEPYITCSGCSFGAILDSLTKVSSHELAEAITDPALNAWWDPNTGDEIGDICNTSTTRLGGYLVQNQWSNTQSACVLGERFTPVYAQGDPGTGIGGYDLKSPADQAFAFDYDGSGKLDYLALYRPGTGTIWILRNSGGNFAPVYAQGDPGTGIGGYDLKSPADRAFAFDYDGSGKLDYLALYRPGTGTIWILRKQ